MTFGMLDVSASAAPVLGYKSGYAKGYAKGFKVRPTRPCPLAHPIWR